MESAGRLLSIELAATGYKRILHSKFFASPVVLLAFLSIPRGLQFSFGPILRRSRKSQSLGTLKLHWVFLYWCWLGHRYKCWSIAIEGFNSNGVIFIVTPRLNETFKSFANDNPKGAGLKKETTEVKKKGGGLTKLCSLSPQGAYDTEVNAVLQDAPLDEKENPGHHVTFQTDVQYIPPDNKVDDEVGIGMGMGGKLYPPTGRWSGVKSLSCLKQYF
nr:sister chromatid cohesion 1 protein 4-like [Tanacetum cinerariifolium]